MATELPPGNYIRSIEVDGLFGQYDYRLQPVDPHADPRILVMYGRNGSGKTTILKLIRSLLSCEDNSGHRAWLSQTPFRRVALSFGGDFSVEAIRKDELQGQFRWLVRRGKTEVASLTIKPRNGRVLVSDWDASLREKYEQIKLELSSIVPQVTYLDDKRTFYEKKRGNTEVRWVARRLSDGSLERVPVQDDPADDPVYASLTQLANAIRREAFLFSNRGSQGAQSIYTSLIERIGSSVSRQEAISQSPSNLISRLRREQQRSEVLSRYGLVSAVDHTEMLRVLETSDPTVAPLLSTVLEPYVESLSARFDALELLHNSIDQWITGLGRFLSPKKVRFKIGDEVQVFSQGNDPLSASALSSGERHLLYLLTQALLMRTTGGILLVDEPELSLNVEWQRRLIRQMVASFGGGPSQLIVASHSLEIAAQYDDNVIELPS